MNIVVASNDADQLDELLNGARSIGERIRPRIQLDIRFALSVEQLAKKRDPETRLVIVAASLPQQRSGSAADPEPGLTLAKSLAREPAPPACIVVSDRLELYRPIQAIDRCELLLVDSSTDYVEQCVQLARRLGIITDGPGGPASAIPLQPQAAGRNETAAAGNMIVAQAQSSPTSKNRQFALLEIDLPRDASFGGVRLEIHKSGGIVKSEKMPLRLDTCALNELIKDSRTLKDSLSRWLDNPASRERYYDRWHAEYLKIGAHVSRLLWGSKAFRKCYYTGQGATEGNVRVRFNLEKPWFDGLWEAISGEEDDYHLILDNTFARRAIPSDQFGIFADGGAQIDVEDGTLNVLVIQSDVPHGSVPSGPDDGLWRKFWKEHTGKSKGGLPTLPHLKQEVNAIRERGSSERRCDKFQVRIHVLPCKTPTPGKRWSLAERVEEHLTTKGQRYDIVHFAGHALFAEGSGEPEADERGYLIFSGFPQPQAVPIGRVAPWLKEAGVQLVYLSCCRSSAASAALEFARNDIPMAIGFHWDLDDSKAAVFARHFYSELLGSNLKVCPAISKARKTLFRQHDRGDPIWASAVLIAQPMDWAAVEGTLRLASKPGSLAIRAA